MRHLIKFFQVIFLTVVISQNIIGQIPEGLGLEFSSSNTKKLEKIEVTFEETKGKLTEAITMYENTPINDTALSQAEINKMIADAVDLLKTASREYQVLTREVYEIYRETVREFWKSQREDGKMPVGLQKAKYLEREARNSFSQSTIKREIINRGEIGFKELLNKLNEANQLEAMALLHEARALRIYQDFPIEYDYDWKDDINLEELLADERRANEELNEKMFGVHKKEVVEKEEKVEEVKEEIKSEPVVIEFRVQIAAHTIPLSNEYINTIYKGDMEVKEIVEDEWYKYQIGSYTSYATAEEILRKVNVERAFIVAYKDAQKCNVTEVKDLAP